MYDADVIRHDADMIMHADMIMYDADMIMYNADMIMYDADMIMHDAGRTIHDADIIMHDADAFLGLIFIEDMFKITKCVYYFPLVFLNQETSLSFLLLRIFGSIIHFSCSLSISGSRTPFF